MGEVIDEGASWRRKVADAARYHRAAALVRGFPPEAVGTAAWGSAGVRALAAIAYRTFNAPVSGAELLALFGGAYVGAFSPSVVKRFAITSRHIGEVRRIVNGGAPPAPAPPARVEAAPTAPPRVFDPYHVLDGPPAAAGRPRKTPACADLSGPPAPRGPHPADAARDAADRRMVAALRARGVGWGAIALQCGRNEITLRKLFDRDFQGIEG